MTNSKVAYRAEIDGLRAVAVISVILYHAKIIIFGRDWFEGGYIGVDIFFVISGYLITRIILSEVFSKTAFDFLNFYERRARRILPMLLTVAVVSLLYGFVKLKLSDFNELIESVVASIFFFSNFFFYYSTTEYGAQSALLKPFLHTWSLGVEEQFYLVFPLLTIIALRYFRNHFLTILVGLSLLSLQFSELMEVRNADLNFYLPFSRFWELAVGSLLAYRELHYKPSNEGFVSKSLPIIGLYLIVYSILFFDAKTPHPSFHTLVPIIGVMLIIGFASKDELVGKVLGSKPFVWVGLISYSAYLWHFPIFAFARMEKTPTNYDKLEWISLTAILSLFSYLLIERTFRKRELISRKIFTVLLTIMLSVICFAYVFSKKGHDFYIANLDKISVIRPITMADSSAYLEQWYDERKFGIQSTSLNGEIPKVLILGNSHGVDFFRSLSARLKEQYNFHVINPSSRKVMFQPSCILVLVKNLNEGCSGYKYDTAELKDIVNIFNETKYVIIASRFHRYPNELNRLEELIEYLKEKDKKVILVSNILEIPYNKITKFHNPFNRFIENNMRFPSPIELSKIEKETFRLVMSNKDVLVVNNQLEEIADKLNIPFVDLTNSICRKDEKRCLVMTKDNKIISWDYGHLAVGATEFVGDLYYDFSSLQEMIDTQFN